MRALPFAILALLSVVLQVSITPALDAAHTLPQLPLILAVYVALYAKADAAMIGCWILGLLFDLATTGVLGGCALAYGLTGAGIVYFRSSEFRDHPLSHVFLALVFCFLANEVVAFR
ncbi:MAG: rod shape-determining protein MreD, partial [Phycisphaerae bacterium]|nr:rod shape-determining protein MreD [Phycisphaerae bacterium]